MEETQQPELQEQNQPEPDMVLSPEAQYYLQQAGKWASFLGIIGFIFTGFIVLAAAFAGTIMSIMSRVSPSPAPFNMGPVLTIVYAILALPYFFSSLYLYQFGTRIKQGIAFINNDSVTSALSKLKSLFKLWGVLAIVLLALYALIIIGMIVGIGIGSAMR